jgi:polyisoprenoid-binding protein YceI
VRRLLLAAAWLATSTPPLAAADWKLDGSASRLEFVASFQKAEAPGMFRQFDTRLRLDADKPGDNRLDVTIDVKSADMNNAEVNKAIAGAEWFHVARFPQAEFHATEIRRTEVNRYLARGMLTLKGSQQAVEVPFTWSEAGDAARMSGEIVVQRGAFGIGTGEWLATTVIGADVKIRFDVRLRKGG